MQPKIKVAFASGTDELNARLIERMRGIFPELPLYVVSEFTPVGADLHWVRYHGGFLENLARCRDVFHTKQIRLAGVLLVPNVPFRRMRLLALILAPLYFLAVNENLNDFMLRPSSLPAIGRHFKWRMGNFLRWHLSGKGARDLALLAARIAGFFRVRRPNAPPFSGNPSLEDPAFLACHVSNPEIFRAHWRRALQNLSTQELWKAAGAAIHGGPQNADDEFLALATGNAAVYAGRPATGKPRVLVVSAYLPFPLSHGGAVRIHNLTSRAAKNWDQVLVCFVENIAAPPQELLDIYIEIVLVRRAGSHSVRSSKRPEVVEQFSSPDFSAMLRLAVKKWQPAIAQLEFTQMAQYARDCAPARTILVEHDITFDLYQQLARNDSDWDLHHQLKLWRRFETAAWREMSYVVTMSAKDRALVTGTRAVALENGVDLERFQVASQEPEPRRLLFIGSFSHLPNLLAVQFFLNEVWPLLTNARLHIIAGANHEYFLDYQSRHVKLQLDQPGIEVEGFVSDVRPAYAWASIVIAPLAASAGTNLKILEAMACGRPVVSTPGGVNGLDLAPGEDFILTQTGPEMAAAIEKLFAAPEECQRLSIAGRRRVEESYGWDSIAARQHELYRDLAVD